MLSGRAREGWPSRRKEKVFRCRFIPTAKHKRACGDSGVLDTLRKCGNAVMTPRRRGTRAAIRQLYETAAHSTQFLDALEDRGYILACVNETDAERLNRWERLRQEERAAALPHPAQPHQPAPTGSTVNRPPQQPEQPKFWWSQTGGVDGLRPDLLQKAEEAYAEWNGPKKKYSLADYVAYTQEQDRIRHEAG